LQQHWQCLITQITVDCLCANNISRLAKTDYMSTTLWGGLAEKNTSACGFKSSSHTRFVAKFKDYYIQFYRTFPGFFRNKPFPGISTPGIFPGSIYTETYI